MLYIVRGILIAASAEGDRAVHRVVFRAPITQITLRVLCTSSAVSSCCLIPCLLPDPIALCSKIFKMAKSKTRRKILQPSGNWGEKSYQYPHLCAPPEALCACLGKPAMSVHGC